MAMHTGVLVILIGGALAAAGPAWALDSDTATMGGGAFSNVQGAFAVNQAAGSNNLQANLLVLGASGQPVSTGTLQQSTASTAGPVDPKAGVHARVGSTSDVLTGARGVVQVNQTAGSGNVTGNAIYIGGGVAR